MKNILSNPIKQIIDLLTLFSCFFLINTQFNEAILDNGYYSKSFSSISEMTKFKINPIDNFNYVRILVEGKSETNNTNHIISFYQQDENLNERKQLSQGIDANTIMWLSKEQFKSETYLTVECEKIPCDFNVELKHLIMQKYI